MVLEITNCEGNTFLNKRECWNLGSLEGIFNRMRPTKSELVGQLTQVVRVLTQSCGFGPKLVNCLF